MLFIGIDLGTSSIKCSLVNEKGKVVSVCSKSYKYSILNYDWCEQNPEDWHESTLYCIEKLISKFNRSDIMGICFSGQMHGLVVLDKYDRIIRPAILWNDNRSKLECEYLNKIVGKNNILNNCGNIAFTGFIAPKLLWMKKMRQVISNE